MRGFKEICETLKKITCNTEYRRHLVKVHIHVYLSDLKENSCTILDPLIYYMV